jgi:glycosyltransferase involved in cell wall biosynthesis
VLEIGCGNGDGALYLAKNHFKVTGIDTSEKGIHQAENIALQNHLEKNAEFLVMDTTTLSFPDDTFDTVIIPEVLEHVRSSQKVLDEAIRVTRNGGRIIISVPDGLLVPWPGHIRIFFKDTLENELGHHSDQITWHDLPFKKWIICSFFVKKEGKNIRTGPKIDIIMPTYNGRRTIGHAIESVLSQTYENWNLVVVNDGGEDISDIIDNYKDPRIHYMATGHKGKSHALNTGLAGSSSEFISYLDDDDILYPIHLEELVHASIEQKSDFVYSDWYEVSLDDEFREFSRAAPFREEQDPEILLTRNFINHNCVLHTRKIIEKAGNYDESLEILIDWDMVRRLAQIAPPTYKPGYSCEHMTYYRAGVIQNQISGLWNKNPKKVEETLVKIFSKLLDFGLSEERMFRCLINAERNYISVIKKDNEIRELLFVNNELRSNYISAATDLGTLQKHLAELTRLHEELTEHYTVMTAERDTKHNQLIEITRVYHDLQMQYNDFEVLYANLQSLYNDLQVHYHAMTGERDFLKTQNEDLQTRNEDLQTHYDLMTADRDRLISVNEDLQTHYDLMTADRDRLISVNEDLQTHYDLMTADRDRLHIHINEIMEHNNRLTLLNETLQAHYSAMSAERDTCVIKNNNLQSELNQYKKSLSIRLIFKTRRLFGLVK